MKITAEGIIISVLGAAWAAGLGVASYVLALNDRITVLEKTASYLEQQISECIKEDVYQVDKLLILEKCTRGK